MQFQQDYAVSDDYLSEDIDKIILEGNFFPIWDGAHVLIVGGTGFVGIWVLKFFQRVECLTGAKIKVTILARNPEILFAKAPYLSAKKNLVLIKGDILSSEILKADFTHMIHAATEASAELNRTDPLKMFDTIVSGTRWALEVARVNKISRSLLLSSGAVYGLQPQSVAEIREDWTGAPSCSDPKSAYSEGKRAAETLFSIYKNQFEISCLTARIFAVVGPHLPGSTHFAIGNFINNAISNKKIVIKTSGLAERSYLYGADLAHWLITILAHGASGCTYNVGSSFSISIASLAKLVNNVLEGSGVEILHEVDQGWNPGRYIPDTRLAKKNLGLSETVNLEASILKTARWYKSSSNIRS